MSDITRRRFLSEGALKTVGLGLGLGAAPLLGQEAGERPQRSNSVKVLNPRHRVPLSFIIDDSTCLVNLAHFAIPQFHETFPERYLQPWKELPREIPDSFVLKFARWCHDHSVKGKYSVVPYPACVGWVDRFIPGWTKTELEDSLNLLRTHLAPDWDFHPEMVSHTRVINTRTGRPYPEKTEQFMENWRWTDGKSVDELADYVSFALKILKNAGIPCEGVTTPGGFAGRVAGEFSRATLEACRDVFNTEIAHYFRVVITDDQSVLPRVENASGIDGDDPKCVVSIPGGTGDRFGGWDGLTPGSVDYFITEDLLGGRLPQIINRGEPAVMVCHWPGIYYNGEELGFKIFKEAVRRVHAAYDNLVWMKLSEIARYWAARELTRTESGEGGHVFRAPYACPDFTLEIPGRQVPPVFTAKGKVEKLEEVRDPLALKSNTWTRLGDKTLVCFNLPRGESRIQ